MKKNGGEKFMMEFMLFQVMIIMLKMIQSCDMCAYIKIYTQCLLRIPYTIHCRQKNTKEKLKKQNKYRRRI